MLENSEAFGSYSVGDVSEAGRFYGETLGLRVSEEDEPMSMLVLHIAGGQDVMVYAKPDHVPAAFTVLNFPIENIEGDGRRVDRTRSALRALRRHGREWHLPRRGPAHRVVQGPCR